MYPLEISSSMIGFASLTGMANPIPSTPGNDQLGTVDPNHLAPAIDKGPSTVAGIDGGIRLDEFKFPLLDGQFPLLGADHARRYGTGKFISQGDSQWRQQVPPPAEPFESP
jgi:hypothetical protein